MAADDSTWDDARTRMELRFVVAEQALSTLDDAHTLLLKTAHVLDQQELAVPTLQTTIAQLNEARSTLEFLAADTLECAQFWDSERDGLEKEENSLVYFIGDPTTGTVKIGFSKSVNRRLAQLQIATTSELQLLGCTVGGPRLEKKLHEQFKPFRVRGEWFRLGPELLQYIQQIGKPGAP